MRGQDIVALLKYEAQRRPDIQQAISNVENLSESDIENLVVPLPWFRQALRVLKARIEIEKLYRQPLDITYNPDRMGHVTTWQGDPTYLKQGSSSLELITGFPVWFPDAGGVWVDTAFFPQIPHQLQGMGPGTPSSLSEYKDLLRVRRLGLL